MALLGKSDSEIDSYFGLESVLETDDGLEESYSDGKTSSEALYTSYSDLEIIRKDATEREITSLADLGAGISRLAFWFRYQNSKIRYQTYEYVKERVDCAKKAYHQKFGNADEVIFQYDLREDFPTDTQAFFLYLPVGETLRKIIQRLRISAETRETYLYVIESHGDLISNLKMFLPELKEIKKYKLTGLRHDPNLYVYSLICDHEIRFKQEALEKKALDAITRSNFFSLEELTFREIVLLIDFLVDFPVDHLHERLDELQFLIKEDRGEWVGTLKGFQHGALDNTLILNHPPRTISHAEMKGILHPKGRLKELIHQRRDALEKPFPRKIFLTPKKFVEFSDGHLESFSD